MAGIDILSWMRDPPPRYTPLFRRVFALNALVLAVACVVTVLVFSPGTVTGAVALRELGVFAAAVALMLVVNLMMTRRAFAPLTRLTEVVRSIEPLPAGRRVEVGGEASEATELAEAFNEMLERLEHDRRDSARRTLAAQEAERLRVAQELHDEVGQSLTGVLLGLGGALKRVPPELRSDLAQAQATARAALEDVRRIAHQLRPEALDDLGLPSALRAMARRVAQQSGLAVDEHVEERLPPLSEEQELVVYRVGQEALTNVVRHSGARHAELALGVRDGRLVLEVSDDGRGIPPGASRGGVRGMRERADLVGATLTLGPRADGGTAVTLEVPL
jgi:two-component system, NarL family, sensor histidine kinase UhpB